MSAGSSANCFGRSLTTRQYSTRAAPRAEAVAVRRRHRHPLDRPLPDVPQHAVVDAHLVHPRLGVQLDPVPANVLHRQVRDGDAGAGGQVDRLAERAVAVEDDLVTITGLAPHGHAVGPDGQEPGQDVAALGELNRVAGLRAVGRCVELVRGTHLDDRAGRPGERRGRGAERTRDGVLGGGVVRPAPARHPARPQEDPPDWPCTSSWLPPTRPSGDNLTRRSAAQRTDRPRPRSRPCARSAGGRRP